MVKKKRKILVIVNKRARKVNAARIIPIIKSHLERSNISLRFKVTPNAKKATKAAQKAADRKYDTVIAVGGDGTINSVLNGIVNRNIKLGVIPMGTGNALSYETGIMQNINDACKTILKNKVRKVDVGLANGRHFLLMCGIGIDAYIVEQTEKIPTYKQTLGKLPYVITSFKAGMTYKQPKVKLVINDTIKVEGYMTVISNIKYYGLIFKMTPYANMDDGYLDVCVFKRGDFLNNIYIFLFGLTRGTHPKRRDVFYYKAKKIKITCDKRAPVHVDGELFGKTPVTVTVVPKAVNLIIP